MPLLTAHHQHAFESLKRNASFLASVVFIVLTLVWADVGKNLVGAVYLLSFWQYYLYWLAYYFGRVSLDVFKRDAILMKTVALAALGFVYLAEPRDLASIVVVGLGFLLNAVAAGALGSDRTYYGYEVADLPPQRIASFPYSWISHPMLIGNIAAFGGTLLNAEFRRLWWPLAGTHVAMNLGLLVMELAVVPRRHRARRDMLRQPDVASDSLRRLIACGVLGIGAAIAAIAGKHETGIAGGSSMAISGCAVAYACVLSRCYSAPRTPSDGRSEVHSE